MKNVNKIFRFISQLLEQKKHQAEKSSLIFKEVELLSFVKNSVSYFDEIGKEKGIEFVITSNVEALFAWVDVEKLGIVIYNLLSNAYKFSVRGNKVMVALEEDAPSGCFRISIIDQGIGIAKDNLNDIFELHIDGERGAGGDQKGSGIGLTLAKELVVLHKGKIYAANNNMHGLTITVELKLDKPDFLNQDVISAMNNHPAAVSEKKITDGQLLTNNEVHIQGNDSFAGPLVLLVEDNIDLRHFLAVQLSENYRVAEAGNGKEGYEKAIYLTPDLIVSDVMMPVMDGIQMLDKLKNDITTSHIPVILLSAKYSIENQIEGLKYGADLYITKPFNNDLLMASITNLIKQRKKLVESIVGKGTKNSLSPGDTIITGKDEEFLKKVIMVVNEGIADPDFNIDNFADAIGMSRSVFFRKLKSLTNSSPVEFVRYMRMKKGKQLLDAGETNIAQVAYAVGFNDAKYFGSCFKKQYHYTPSEYLKEMRS
jgi:CheY-like chemotaxis protein/AraC-like DNA-binding protein/anti-sigma regulatory factor (Ser/Thr protein kinase)